MADSIPDLAVGLRHHQAGRLAEAEAVYRLVLAASPRHADALHLLGLLAHQSGGSGRAADLIGQAIAIDEGRSAFHYNLGIVRQALGDLPAAERSYRRATALMPNYADALNNLGIVLSDQRKSADAEVSYRAAIAARPDFAAAWNNLGNTLRDRGQLEEASKSYRRAIELQPGCAEAHNHLGTVLQLQARPAAAMASYRRAIELAPGLTEARSNLLNAMSYDPQSTPAEIFAAHREHAATLAPARPPMPHRNAAEPGRRLRIGYVSPDFRSHSCAYFIEPLIAGHRRTDAEIFCYAQVKAPDSVTERLRSRADHWRSTVGLTDGALAELVRGDGIDILVDLAGHTAGNRLAAFALKPAPVQVSYLGYPTTTGLTAMDWRLTDAHADPPGDSDAVHVERLYRLPRGFHCYAAPREAPDVTALPALSAGQVTFASFNNLAKVTPAVIALWSRLLREIPGSRLMLKALQTSDQATIDDFRRRFAEHGVGADRLEFSPWQGARGDHLALYGRVDIGLDPFPYNGTTTTCEAGWMGVPVITLAGDAHAGRVGVSLSCAMGVPELMAADADSYVGIARRLAGDLPRLAALRSGLRDRMKRSSLGDADGFVGDVEAAYRSMWKIWCDERPDTRQSDG